MSTSCWERKEMLTCILLINVFLVAHCWDSDDLELFDLVEEVNGNFYELIGVSQSASSSEVKRAYRKQTLLLHPDKNKADDAEDQFRKLVAVYEVLKDDEKRAKYNSVLENGLPDWRQPVFYYRKVRKLGVLELSAFVCAICTLGHYLVMWAMYLERRLAMEDYFNSRKKREKKGKRKAATVNEQIDDAMQETLDAIPQPRLRNLWPVMLARWLVVSVVSIPRYVANVRKWRNMAEERRRAAQEEHAREAAFLEELEQRRIRRKQKPDPCTEATPAVVADGAPVLYGQDDTELSQDNDDEHIQQTSREGAWSDEDFVLLSKAYLRFPGGTANRWEKIADFVGRPISQVTSKCKEMKGNFQMNLGAAVQGSNPKPPKKNIEISDTIISTPEPEWIGPSRSDQDVDQLKARKRLKNKPVKDKERTLIIPKQPVIKSERENDTGSMSQELFQTSSCISLPKQTGDTLDRNKLEKSVIHSVNQSENLADAQTCSGDKLGVSVGAKNTSNKVEKAISKSAKSNKAKLVGENAVRDEKSISKTAKSNKGKDVSDNADGGASWTDESETWSQNHQVILEWALKQYPKGTEQRWEKIAKDIPGKTKEDCIARFKLLAELVKQRKQQAS